MENLKKCTKCGEEKPATVEYFNKGERYKDGLNSKCKFCIKEYSKKYRKENKEYFKQYYIENENKIKEHNKEYKKQNKNKIKEYNREYRNKNKNKIKEYNREYCKEYYNYNKDKIKKYNEDYQKENKERCCQYTKKRRMLKKQLPATLTLSQWQQIKSEFNNKCAYCGEGEDLEQEHFIPISKGGEYTHKNIIPACKSCNCSKNNTYFEEWYPTYKYYSEERERYILDYLKSIHNKLN